ncbi:MAG: endopeptidase La [Armatimonadetes bacterium]|nr:endopeptidase La [Armatimonadota bacterium]
MADEPGTPTAEETTDSLPAEESPDAAGTLSASEAGESAGGVAPGNGPEDNLPPIPEVLNILPLRDIVLFPGMMAPLHIARENWVALVDEAAAKGNRFIGVSTVRDPGVEIPGIEDLHRVGCAAYIRMMLKLPDGIRLMLQGVERIELGETLQTEPYLQARVRPLPSAYPTEEEDRARLEALRRAVGEAFDRVVQLSPNLRDDLVGATDSVPDAGILSDLITANLPVANADKQDLLETPFVLERLTRLLALLTREAQMLELQGQIQSQVSGELSKTQRDYYLREQLKAIQRELGDADDTGAEVDELRERVEESGMPEEARREADRELGRLSRIPAASPEYTVARNYLDWLLAMPWNKATQDNLDIPQVKQTLDEDHFGLERVKDRLLEYLSVRKFRQDGAIRQPILCLAGPPGVGKTSLGRSVAEALGRKFIRISLGGVRDEAEIRGHRRTYIGALPGQIIQGIRRAESNNPVMILDEVDKIGQDFRGDPTSALLEVLDPEQNSTFRDHYLDVPFDLSRVLFITTANQLETIPGPLRDRMEIIEIAGYTEEEKKNIAKQHLIPKQMTEHGLSEENIAFTDDAVRMVVRGYTREAGVRNLEREIARLCRKVTREFAEGRDEKAVIDEEAVRRYLGAPRFEAEEIKDRVRVPGVATGLAWTPVGGDVLFVEATLMPGRKTLVLTGMLGDVMKESAQAALSWVRSHAEELGIPARFFSDADLHIHVPAGAIPKDGPSAGVTMVTALVSLLTGRKDRPLVAMTGEVTLSGRVLPVGGIKEKVLAAHRAGIRTVILPERNRKDVDEDVPREIKDEMTFHFAGDVKQVLEWALEAEGAPPPMPEPMDGNGERAPADGRVIEPPVVTVRPTD